MVNGKTKQFKIRLVNVVATTTFKVKSCEYIDLASVYDEMLVYFFDNDDNIKCKFNESFNSIVYVCPPYTINFFNTGKITIQTSPAKSFHEPMYRIALILADLWIKFFKENVRKR